jgi:hypothetical protein
MGKPADIEPRWLVSLMCVWAVHERASDNRHMGYPSQAAFLTIGRSTVAHADPTGFCAQDFTELETALESLKRVHLGQYMAMMMYYKPWGVEACRAEGWPFGDSTYYARLHAAHKRVAGSIDDLRLKIA